MADDNARINSTRTPGMVETVFTLHDRLIVFEEEIREYEDLTRRDIDELRGSVDDLRRLILLFGSVALVAVIVAMVTAFHAVAAYR